MAKLLLISPLRRGVKYFFCCSALAYRAKTSAIGRKGVSQVAPRGCPEAALLTHVSGVRGGAVCSLRSDMGGITHDLTKYGVL
jgi:hypothetical protein